VYTGSIIGYYVGVLIAIMIGYLKCDYVWSITVMQVGMYSTSIIGSMRGLYRIIGLGIMMRLFDQ
jgi:hypothetical protein